ncbi:MAG: hypothetical protein HY096_00230 [Nitrospinae bacterium]|nr:hypothetical protein [Nitrospinota bacterium]
MSTRQATYKICLTVFVVVNLFVLPPLANAGWFVRVCTSKTEASAINLWIGLGGEDRTHRFWKKWKSSDSAQFDMPDDIKNVQEIWIKGEAVPHGRNAYMCIFYNDHVVKHMDFDESEEHEKRQDDHDDECACSK